MRLAMLTKSRNLRYMRLLRKAQNPISTVVRSYTALIAESMKGPEAKVLYGRVLDQLAKEHPGGKDKIKGLC